MATSISKKISIWEYIFYIKNASIYSQLIVTSAIVIG